MLTIVEQAGRTDVGRQRTGNEDAYLESSSVFCVADGMGGARAGEVASRIAIETLADGGGSDERAEARLARTARDANRRIHELGEADESLRGMGTTFTAVLVEDGDVVAGHVGDSRLYRLREGELERLTRDHSLVEELVRRGELQPDEAESHPQRSILTRALGPDADVEVETFTSPGRDGDVYLICSDGLTTMVPEDRIGDMLRAAGSLDDAAAELVQAANEAGGRDNITVVLFRLGTEESLGETGGSTLSDQETRADLQATEVHAAIADEERETAVRASPSAGPRRGRLRRWLTGGIGLLLLAALVTGFYLGSREFYFLGTNERGVVTLYRGLPYALPLDIELYEQEYASAVPAASIQPPARRQEIIDHRLRERGDAVDLLRRLELGRLAPSPGIAPTPPPGT
ncbi:MAG TPA: Stp1/IreP family PP2C-type Ser/Thr phosphatase [Thermoleophilaceae bacterium]|nr:Stp1/IreP family PP2C-type Ser/Thr phosphatase [Thermoleophilaceae bacterium]